MKLFPTVAIFIPLAFLSCARTDFYYPTGKEVVDEKGRINRPHGRAIVLNGSDSLGATRIRITRNSLEFENAGGIDNSTSTKAGYRTLRYGIGAAATVAGVAIPAMAAASSYNAEQAAVATTSAAASRSAASQAATKAATTVRLAEIQAAQEAAARAIPAAGSTIPSIIPSVVTPVP